MSSIDPSTSVLFLHPPGLEDQVDAFLSAFITSTSASPLPPNSSSSSPRRYKISNKYYSTTIHLRPLAIPSDVEGPEVFEEALDGVGGVAWVFGHTKDTRPIPPLLQALASVQPDIQLAIHIQPPSDQSSLKPTAQLPSSICEPEEEEEGEKHDDVASQSTIPTPSPPWNIDSVDRAYEIFSNLSMDFIDLSPPSSTSEGANSSDEERDAAFEEIKQALEVHMWPGMIRTTGAVDTTPTLTSRRSDSAEEDEIDRILSSAPPIQQKGNFDANGFVELEEWLNLDEAGPASGLQGEEPTDDGFGDDFSPFQSGKKEVGNGQGSKADGANSVAGSSRTVVRHINNTFTRDNADGQEEDDFNIDPSTLFQHLQNVRTELSSLGNEDERRSRAAKEVVNIFNGMGIDLDLGLDELEGEGGASSGGTGEMGRVGGALDMSDLGFDDEEGDVVRRVMEMTRGEGWEGLEEDGGNRRGEELAELMEALGVKDED